MNERDVKLHDPEEKSGRSEEAPGSKYKAGWRQLEIGIKPITFTCDWKDEDRGAAREVTFPTGGELEDKQHRGNTIRRREV